MAKMTIFFGVVLIVLGVWGFVATGSAHPTALIPTWTGLSLAVSGALARTEDAKQRMLWMHVAVSVGLLGFLGAGSRGIVELVKAQGGPFSHEMAVATMDQLAMAIICLVYVLLCVRSFIAVRRTRNNAA